MTGVEDEKGVVTDRSEYSQAMIALIVLGFILSPFLCLIIGFALRCFLWAAGFKPSFFN